ncbi:hypothetical protein L4C34_10355 [Vibrio profundum]|uniref:hypothetical protein n=1 Tax=Vibrio profundum TaxID=2910247 RepID=UPI003D112436
MAETKNIGVIAEIISSQIFTEMKWDVSDKTDINWDCCMRSHLTKAQQNAEKPKIKTHPTDIVFSYPDPYNSEVTIYVQTDLKSYSKKTIRNYSDIMKTIRSLSEQVECSSKSQEWRSEFLLQQPSNYKVHGMLFIYNHDEMYDDDLLTKLSGVPNADYSLPSDSMMAIFDPKTIRFLLSSVEEINRRRNIPCDSKSDEILWQKIPSREKCGFFYPDKHNKISVKDTKLPASIEMITSGMLMFTYEHDFFVKIDGDTVKRENKKILNIFWSEDALTKNPFIFVLEYIFNYQLLSQFDRIYICTPFSSESSSYLQQAITSYAGMYSFNAQQLTILKDTVISIPIHTKTVSIFDFQVASKNHSRICDFG